MSSQLDEWFGIRLDMTTAFATRLLAKWGIGGGCTPLMVVDEDVVLLLLLIVGVVATGTFGRNGKLFPVGVPFMLLLLLWPWVGVFAAVADGDLLKPRSFRALPEGLEAENRREEENN